MKQEVFDLLLGFHLALIRREPSTVTQNNAMAILVGDDKKLTSANRDERSKARKLADNLKERESDLAKFKKADWNGKVKVYQRPYLMNPSGGVFDALKFVLYNDVKIGTAARECGVNFQSVKVLKPRFELYINTAAKLEQCYNDLPINEKSDKSMANKTGTGSGQQRPPTPPIPTNP
tara:strand:- start:3145 stop:3675 length:531 start_codon:yes stop_codon:yes gene_type:complete